MTVDVTRDAFLGGKIHLYQPVSGYRAGVDPVILAATVPAVAGQSVLDLGCGVGAAALCLGARVPGLQLTGVEIQKEYAELARQNGGDGFEVVCADIAEMPLHVRDRLFDHVIANPPYYNRAASKPTKQLGRETALGESLPLADWIKIASRRVAPKGYLHLIHRAERLPEIITGLMPRLGSIEVLPIAPRVDARAELVVVRARKNRRDGFRLHAPLVLHEGVRHDVDGDSYRPRIRAALREGGDLLF